MMLFHPTGEYQIHTKSMNKPTHLPKTPLKNLFVLLFAHYKLNVTDLHLLKNPFLETKWAIKQPFPYLYCQKVITNIGTSTQDKEECRLCMLYRMRMDARMQRFLKRWNILIKNEKFYKRHGIFCKERLRKNVFLKV